MLFEGKFIDSEEFLQKDFKNNFSKTFYNKLKKEKYFHEKLSIISSQLSEIIVNKELFISIEKSNRF